jgi:hypothetical protein
MSTLNVANISDDQSTLSNSANPSDKLNNTTTVDTKFVTNGCAKAWARGDAGGTSVEGFNISGMVNDGTGLRTFNFMAPITVEYSVSTSAESGGPVSHMYFQMNPTYFKTMTTDLAGNASNKAVSLAINGELE